MIVFDIETDGLLNDLTRIHLLTVHRPTGVVSVYRRNDNEDTIAEGLRDLQESVAWAEATLAGHNVIAFDIPAIQKVYPWFNVPQDKVFDTLVAARLIHADTSVMDSKLKLKGKLPGNLFGSHSLEAWGYRLGEMKGEYEGDSRIADPKERKKRKWEAWNPDMETYGVQDVVVTRKLLDHLKPREYSGQALDLEHRVQWIVQRQVRRGFAFDEQAAADLYATLTAKRADLHRQLRETIPGAFWQDGPIFTPKADNKRFGYCEGAKVTKIVWKDFNPSSRAAIARFLKDRHGWMPTRFTEGGDPAVDDAVLSALPYPEAKLLAEYFLLEKRIGQLAEGNQALLKVVRKGRIHGSVNTNGAVTGRMTHSYPNVAQTPRVGTPYGTEFRSLYRASGGMVLVGADASGLELRCLAHYMARWDGGKYGEVILNGDIHTVNQHAAGLPDRNKAKTFIYAFLYGAGPDKIGSIVGKGRTVGLRLKQEFLRKTPALRKLVEAVQEKVQQSNTLKGLDGRTLFVRSAHAALNTLLQSAGALVMKQALVILDETLQGLGLIPGDDYEFVANVHDEWQIECKESHADTVASCATEAIRRAGETFGFRCPLAGEAKIGRSWADTH